MPETTGRMRILKVVQSYFPFQDRGGPVFKVRALATGLAKRGHRVTVLTADLGFGREDGFRPKQSVAAGVGEPKTMMWKRSTSRLQGDIAQ